MAAPDALHLSREVAIAVFYGFGVLGVSGLGYEIYSELNPGVFKPIHPRARWFGIFAGALIFFVLSWRYWPLGVYPAFKSAFAEHPELGVPLDRASDSVGAGFFDSNSAYEAELAKKRVIWLSADAKYYIMDIANGTFQSANDDPASDAKYYSLNERCRLLHTPNDSLPPFGGLAKLWSDVGTADRWGSSFGWVHWQGFIEGTKVFYQRFEHGIIIGPVRRYSEPNYKDALIYILIDDGKERRWYEMPSGAAAPEWLDSGMQHENVATDHCIDRESKNK